MWATQGVKHKHHPAPLPFLYLFLSCRSFPSVFPPCRPLRTCACTADSLVVTPRGGAPPPPTPRRCRCAARCFCCCCWHGEPGGAGSYLCHLSPPPPPLLLDLACALRSVLPIAALHNLWSTLPLTSTEIFIIWCAAPKVSGMRRQLLPGPKKTFSQSGFSTCCQRTFMPWASLPWAFLCCLSAAGLAGLAQ